MSGFLTLQYESTSLRVRGKVERSVSAGIFEVQINAELHEGLENLNLRVSSSLMNTIVAMDVL